MSGVAASLRLVSGRLRFAALGAWSLLWYRAVARRLGHGQLIYVDYPVTPGAALDSGQPFPEIAAMFEGQREIFRANLAALRAFSSDLGRIAARSPSAGEPSWLNEYLWPLDAAALYAFVARHRPPRIVEVGSGESTKFIRRAIRDHGLETQITSIDPRPRANIDHLVDRAIRQPLERVDPALFAELRAGDAVFFDGSHRAFQDSDVTVFFLRVLPSLPPGVLVHVHDIWLPGDYPPSWVDRFYSEHYLLAGWLLGRGHARNVLLANAFISADRELSAAVAPIWDVLSLREVPEERRSGTSFWFETN